MFICQIKEFFFEKLQPFNIESSQVQTVETPFTQSHQSNGPSSKKVGLCLFTFNDDNWWYLQKWATTLLIMCTFHMQKWFWSSENYKDMNILYGYEYIIFLKIHKRILVEILRFLTFWYEKKCQSPLLNWRRQNFLIKKLTTKTFQCFYIKWAFVV